MFMLSHLLWSSLMSYSDAYVVSVHLIEISYTCPAPSTSSILVFGSWAIQLTVKHFRYCSQHGCWTWLLPPFFEGCLSAPTVVYVNIFCWCRFLLGGQGRRILDEINATGEKGKFICYFIFLKPYVKYSIVFCFCSEKVKDTYFKSTIQNKGVQLIWFSATLYLVLWDN